MESCDGVARNNVESVCKVWSGVVFQMVTTIPVQVQSIEPKKEDVSVLAAKLTTAASDTNASHINMANGGTHGASANLDAAALDARQEVAFRRPPPPSKIPVAASAQHPSRTSLGLSLTDMKANRSSIPVPVPRAKLPSPSQLPCASAIPVKR